MATVNYTYTEIQNGFNGLVHNNNPSFPTRLYGVGNKACWIGVITGTDAVMAGRNLSDLFAVSVDGSAFSYAPNASGQHTLFSGLADEGHFVVVKINEGYSTSGGWWETASTLLSVDGSAPSASVLNYVNTYLDDSLIFSGSTIAVGNALYDLSLTGLTFDTVLAPVNGKVMLSTDASSITVFANATSGFESDLYYSIDGGTVQTVVNTGSLTFRIEGLSGQHTYNFWMNRRNAIMSIHADSQMNKVGARLDQFGDSISYGLGTGNNNALVETHEVAAFFGYVGNDWAASGWTVNDLLTELTSGVFTSQILAHQSRENDVAVLAIGRNSTGIDTDSTIQSEYTAIIDHLVNSIGYAKVLCRGILPESGLPYTAQNAMIESLVDAYNDPNVVYVDVSGWTSISTTDSTHPDATGYDQMVDYAKVSYAPYIGNLQYPTLNVSITGNMPDGTYRTILINDAETVVYAGDVAFVSGAAAITLPGTVSESDTLRGIVEAANGTDVAPIKGTVVLA